MTSLSGLPCQSPYAWVALKIFTDYCGDKICSMKREGVGDRLGVRVVEGRVVGKFKKRVLRAFFSKILFWKQPG